MKGIGGNITGTIQTANTTINAIGEQIRSWTNAAIIKGWIDLLNGDSNRTNFNAKIQESTHVFVADYVVLPASVKTENSRMVINGKHYDITMIDNPMEMKSGSQLEIYLKYTGGQ